jgi:hypothetical protein
MSIIFYLKNKYNKRKQIEQIEILRQRENHHFASSFATFRILSLHLVLRSFTQIGHLYLRNYTYKYLFYRLQAFLTIYF